MHQHQLAFMKKVAGKSQLINRYKFGAQIHIRLIYKEIKIKDYNIIQPRAYMHFGCLIYTALLNGAPFNGSFKCQPDCGGPAGSLNGSNIYKLTMKSESNYKIYCLFIWQVHIIVIIFCIFEKMLNQQQFLVNTCGIESISNQIQVCSSRCN